MPYSAIYEGSAMEEEKAEAGMVESLIELVNEIAAISDYRPMLKKQYCNLARRLKLLTPMFEEIRDLKKDAIPLDTSKAMLAFKEALQSSRELLRFGSEGSKIYMVCASIFPFHIRFYFAFENSDSLFLQLCFL